MKKKINNDMQFSFTPLCAILILFEFLSLFLSAKEWVGKKPQKQETKKSPVSHEY